MIASIGGAPVDAQGLTFSNLDDLTEIAACDVLCVPGGLGCLDAAEDIRFIHAIRHLAGTAKFVTSVCTGSLILGAAGLLHGRRAACHWAWRDMLPLFGTIPDPARVVRDDEIITGGGVTAGIDFALTVIAELTDDETTQRAQLILEYAPAPPFDAKQPQPPSTTTSSPTWPSCRPHVTARRNTWPSVTPYVASLDDLFDQI